MQAGAAAIVTDASNGILNGVKDRDSQHQRRLTDSLRVGAERVGRPVPPLIAHAPVCVHENANEVRAAVRQQIMNPRLPFYQRMLIAAGFPKAADGTLERPHDRCRRPVG